ncbi:MAG: RNA 2',3'-cyclic phosphodiesterase [Chloroflexota bacterium]|nr:RNA 2',3'-cyclic phosphodiesterase [Chloroflexota bacterium]MDE2885886.1 RNA 2',3'-cyclic phosphodiesterase [Chloroflexota bacterium]
MAEGNLRLFVAIAFPDEVRAELKRVAGAMRAFAPRGTRWANVDGAHLTLRFIGSTPPDAAPPLGNAVDRAADGVAPFELSLAGAGVFPPRGAPRVLWVGVGGALEALIGLRDSLEDAFEAAGIPRDKRAFTPHVTLARVNARLSRDEAQALRELVAALDVRPVAFAVQEFGLYNSDLLSTGAVYTRLASARLVG